MLKSIFKIGLCTPDESDFALFTDICHSITSLNISFSIIKPGELIKNRSDSTEIPVYVVHQSYFELKTFQKGLETIQNQNVPICCLLEDSSEENAEKALNYKCDFWICKDSVNKPIFQSTLIKAEQTYRLKEQTQYLRKKFHESEKRFLSVFRSKPEAVIVIDKNNLIRFVNPSCEKELGVDYSKVGTVFPFNLKVGTIKEIDLHAITGISQKFEVVVSELIWENELCRTLTFQDKTEQLRIKNNMLTFQKVIHLSPVPILITDIKGLIIYANKAFEKSTGYTLEEITGHTPRILNSGDHDAAFYKELWKTILSGKTWRGEICNKNKAGKKFREQQMISPIKGENGEILYFTSIRTDDLEKRKEEKKQQEANTLKTVQELAGGIAHEFSQPLQVLSISMSLMEKEIGHSEYFEKAEKMIKRIILLVDNLKSITTLRQQDYLSSKIIDIKASSEKSVTQSKISRILIIDDEIEVLESLVDLLSLSGYNCEGVTSGAEALEKLSKNAYRLIISDIDMPGMGGTELFKRIKQTNFEGYFVFMTGYEVDDDLGDEVRLADAFLTKPFEMEKLKELVDKIFSEKKMEP